MRAIAPAVSDTDAFVVINELKNQVASPSSALRITLVLIGTPPIDAALCSMLLLDTAQGTMSTSSRGLLPLDDRRMRVLRMLAEGADTQEISHSLSYSERTIKGLIGEIERLLGARSRAQAVAEGIRQGLI